MSAGILMRYVNGTFGGAERTGLVYAPAMIRVEAGRLELTAFLPYLNVGDAGGLGDIVAFGGYKVHDDLLSGLQVIVTGRVKFPTASFSRGLGTGKPDVGVSGAVHKMGLRGWVSADAGFVLVGDPEGYDLRNVAIWSVGGGRRIAGQVYLLGSISGNSPLLPDFSAPVEAGVGVGVRLRNGLTLTAVPSVGFSSSERSWGITTGISTSLRN